MALDSIFQPQPPAYFHLSDSTESFMSPMRKVKHRKPTIGEHRLPLRIVPLHSVPVSTAAATPELTYRNGPLLTNVEVFTIFCGAAWQDSANASLLTHMNDFFDFILISKLIDQLAEYNVAGKIIGHGKRTGTITFASSEPGKSVSDATI